ncbi:MAG: alpha-glucosidase C-terminal domain-containing protein, partial [Chloroflexota bacterium]
INVRDQHGDPLSLWHFYRRMLRLRKNNPALIEGDYQAIQTSAVDYFAFLRTTGNQKLLVILSYTQNRLALDLSSLPFKTAETIFSSAGRSKPLENLNEIHLGAFEIYLAELK